MPNIYFVLIGVNCILCVVAYLIKCCQGIIEKLGILNYGFIIWIVQYLVNHINESKLPALSISLFKKAIQTSTLSRNDLL